MAGRPFRLERFVAAQAGCYATALAEIRAGRKRTHWMWFVFPQLTELGRSAMARLYGIGSIEEARAYLSHPVLGNRYVECVAALQALPTRDAVAVFGEVDAMKLCSSLTLFAAARDEALFDAAITEWYGGVADTRTIALLSGGSAATR